MFKKNILTLVLVFSVALGVSTYRNVNKVYAKTVAEESTKTEKIYTEKNDNIESLSELNIASKGISSLGVNTFLKNDISLGGSFYTELALESKTFTGDISVDFSIEDIQGNNLENIFTTVPKNIDSTISAGTSVNEVYEWTLKNQEEFLSENLTIPQKIVFKVNMTLDGDSVTKETIFETNKVNESKILSNEINLPIGSSITLEEILNKTAFVVDDAYLNEKENLDMILNRYDISYEGKLSSEEEYSSTGTLTYTPISGKKITQNININFEENPTASMTSFFGKIIDGKFNSLGKVVTETVINTDVDAKVDNTIIEDDNKVESDLSQEDIVESTSTNNANEEVTSNNVEYEYNATSTSEYKEDSNKKINKLNNKEVNLLIKNEI